VISIKKILKSPEFLPLGILVVVGLILRFWNLAITEVAFDNATNTFRAVGWFDFLTGKGQTTPIIWYGSIPWWGNLSFHDHPPLVFAIQWLMSQLWGQGALAMHAAYALAMTAAGVVLYYIGKKQSVRVSQLALLFFTVSSYSLWIARTGFLEGIQILFLTLAGLYLVRLGRSGAQRDYLLLGLMIGLSLLAKYTSIYLLPAAFLYLLSVRRELLHPRHWWKPLIVLVLTLTPIIIYNSFLLATRGHFDAALSSMVGMHPADYEILKRGVNTQAGSNLVSIWQVMIQSSSLPFTLAFMVSLLALVFDWIRHKASDIGKLAVIHWSLIAIMFLFSGVVPRFWTITIPYMMLIMAFGAGRLLALGRQKLWYSLIALLCLLELFFAINTNLVARPLGSVGLTYSSDRWNERGYYALDAYLKTNAYGTLPPMRHVTRLTPEVTGTSINGRAVIIYDERADWNERMWYVFRYQHYYNVPIIYPTDLIESMRVSGQNSMMAYLQEAGATGVWVVIAQQHSPIDDKGADYDQLMTGIQASFEAQGLAPKQIIRDSLGAEAFRVYFVALR